MGQEWLLFHPRDFLIYWQSIINYKKEKFPYGFLDFMVARVAAFPKNWKKKNILTYAVIQILKIVLVDVKEMAYSPDTVFIALGSTPELKKKTKKTAKQLICISTLRNKLI